MNEITIYISFIYFNMKKNIKSISKEKVYIFFKINIYTHSNI